MPGVKCAFVPSPFDPGLDFFVDAMNTMYGPATLVTNVRGIVGNIPEVRTLSNAMARNNSENAKMNKVREIITRLLKKSRAATAALETTLQKYQAWHTQYASRFPNPTNRKRKRSATITNMPLHLIHNMVAPKLTSKNMASAMQASKTMVPALRNSMQRRRRNWVNTAESELRQLVKATIKLHLASTTNNVRQVEDGFYEKLYRFNVSEFRRARNTRYLRSMFDGSVYGNFFNVHFYGLNDRLIALIDPKDHTRTIARIETVNRGPLQIIIRADTPRLQRDIIRSAIRDTIRNTGVRRRFIITKKNQLSHVNSNGDTNSNSNSN